MAVPMQVRVPERPREDMDSLVESGRIRAPETCGEAVASEARVREVPGERRGNGLLPEVCAAPSFHSRRGGRGRRKAGRRLRRPGDEERPCEARGKTRARRRASLRQVDFRASSCHGQMDVHLDQLDDGGRPVGYCGREAFPDGQGPGAPPRAAAKVAKREGL